MPLTPQSLKLMAQRAIHTHADLSGLAAPAFFKASSPLSTSAPRQPGKAEGDISAIFSSLSGEALVPLPQRFADLKRYIIGSSPDVHAQLVESWRDLLAELEKEVQVIQDEGSDVIPEVSFDELSSGNTGKWVEDLKKRGVVLVRDVVDDEQALKWKQAVREYVAANPQVKGFPADNKQVFELYWSKSQLAARSHPNVLTTQKTIMKTLVHSDPTAAVSLDHPISYADRLRIRLPGDAKFALGPHIDGGSLERWEDGPFRNCYREILAGHWRKHDPWDVGRRLGITSDLYNGPNQCSIFRAFQGWLSLSTTGPTEGTLRVFPLLTHASAYVLLRPFFRPTLPATSPRYLRPETWVLDLDSTAFPNAAMGKAQELDSTTHPHLQLDSGGMVSMKKVNPGDMVLWYCDTIHAVESAHRGTSDSSVLYIPAAPLTRQNAAYLARQRDAMTSGVPAPDFPGGDGEMGFRGAGKPEDISNSQGRQAAGLQHFEITDDASIGQRAVVNAANTVLGL